MRIPFYKYQGTGNDFVVIDQLEHTYLTRDNVELVKHLCDRRFGIGADGLILVEASDQADFEMVYFNADGHESTMCGNGGRCISAFAAHLGIVDRDKIFSFLAIDGIHLAKVRGEGDYVELRMSDVLDVQIEDNFYLLDTGSPHYVTFVEDLDDIDVFENGRAIRYSSRFRQNGVNVNFVELKENNLLHIGTYERGVEDQTLSCGTGMVAAALCHSIQHNIIPSADNTYRVPLHTLGGEVEVRFSYHKEENRYSDIWLCGPAVLVFEGRVEV